METTSPVYALQYLAVATCHRSPTNPRKRFPSGPMAELTDSVREHGVIQPIVVRPWPAEYPAETDIAPEWEIVAGERRWRAATAAGVEWIPAIERTLSTAQVVELQLVENLQREDVLPSEEAEGYRRMIDEHGYTAERLAETVGKSRAYIYGRLKLMDLCPDARTALDDGKLSASLAQIIARIPAAQLQSDMITRTAGMSYRVACDYLRNACSTALSEAPWDPADPDMIAEAGPCTLCPHNSRNAPDAEADIGPDVCTHLGCYDRKRAAAVERQKREARESGQPVIDGTAAAKLIRYGHIDDDAPVLDLDARCYTAPLTPEGERPTYRELLGGQDVPITLIEDAHNRRMVEAVDKTAMAQALESAGVRVPEARQPAESAKDLDAMRKAERDYRLALIRAIRQACAADLEGSTAPRLDDNGLRLIVRALWKKTWSESQKAVARLYTPAGGTVLPMDRATELTQEIETMTPAELILFGQTVALIDYAQIHTYTTDLTTPEPLLNTARDYLIEPAAVKKSAKSTGATAAKRRPPKSAPRGEGESASDEKPEAPKPAPKAARAKKSTRAAGKGKAAGAARTRKKSGRETRPEERQPRAMRTVERCPHTRDLIEEAGHVADPAA